MNKRYIVTGLMIGLLVLAVLTIAEAGDVKIVAAEFHNTGDSRWSVWVTLKHDDTGWDHYTDNWRVVDDQGNVLGNRMLYHPHVEEQPFTRGLDTVEVPESILTVYIEAHDKIHGWTKNRLTIDLDKASSGSLRVEAD